MPHFIFSGSYLLRVAVLVFAAALPYSFRLPLSSGIRGGVRNSRDDHNTATASRMNLYSIPCGVRLTYTLGCIGVAPDTVQGRGSYPVVRTTYRMDHLAVAILAQA